MVVANQPALSAPTDLGTNFSSNYADCKLFEDQCADLSNRPSSQYPVIHVLYPMNLYATSLNILSRPAPEPAVEGSFGSGVCHVANRWQARTVVDAVATVMTVLMMAMIKHPVDYLFEISHTKRGGQLDRGYHD